MIAVVDIGNTRTKCAVFGEEGQVLDDQIFATGDSVPPGAEAFLAGSYSRAVIASVVPALTAPWAQRVLKNSDVVHVAGHDSPWGFELGVESPATVGVDRLANMEAALSFPGSVLVIDAGTATKFDLLEGFNQRKFSGGAIAPGVGLSYEALVANTALLPRIELNKHSPVVGYNTETAIRSGVVHGFAALVDGMVMKIFQERQLPNTTAVVTTGGNSSFLAGRAQLISHARPRLTLEGLYGLAKKL